MAFGRAVAKLADEITTVDSSASMSMTGSCFNTDDRRES